MTGPADPNGPPGHLEVPGTPPLIRVLLADDHTLVRAGFRALLEQSPDIKVVAETADGREVPRLVDETLPDVAVLDIAMPGNGLTVAAALAARSPEVRVIILSMYANDEYIEVALKSGAAGYLVKDAAPAELGLAVRAVMRGQVYLSPVVSTRVVAEFVSGGGGGPGNPHRLTARQREVLGLIAGGETTKAIARQLGISAKTVETYRAQIMERLDIHEIAGLVRYAVRTGIVAPDS